MERAKKRKVPAGYHFRPTDFELVSFYLQRKVNGESLPDDVVNACELYGDKEPWLIFDTSQTRRFYVFAQLTKKSESRFLRTAGCGTWTGQNCNNVYGENNKHIGFKKLFVFKVKEDGTSRTNTSRNGHWLMHEYSLLDEGNLTVLCEIEKKEPNNSDESTSNNHIQTTELPHVEIQCKEAQRLNKRKLRSEEGNQQSKTMRISSPMDNIMYDFREDILPSSFPTSNLISEPAPASSSQEVDCLVLESGQPNIMYDFGEDILPPSFPTSNLISEPAPASSSQEDCIVVESGQPNITYDIGEFTLPSSFPPSNFISDLISEPAPGSSSQEDCIVHESGQPKMDPHLLPSNAISGQVQSLQLGMLFEDIDPTTVAAIDKLLPDLWDQRPSMEDKDTELVGPHLQADNIDTLVAELLGQQPPIQESKMTQPNTEIAETMSWFPILEPLCQI